MKKIYPKWSATIKNKRIFFKDREGFYNHLFPFNNKEVEIIVKPKTKERSRKEEKFYRGVVVKAVAEEMGIFEYEAHEFLAKLFLIEEKKAKNGMRYERVRSTTELSDIEYRDFWQNCIRWANQELDLYIPYPNECSYDD